MIRFIRDPQPPHNATYKAGMVRALAPQLEAQFIASGDAVDFVEADHLYPAPRELFAAGSKRNELRKGFTAMEADTLRAMLSGRDGVVGAALPPQGQDVVLSFAKGAGLVSQADEAAVTLSGGQQRIAEAACRQSALPVRTLVVGASGTLAVGACAIVGIQAVTLGAGSLTVHDDINTAADATRLRFERAATAMVAGSYYPMVSDDPAAMLFDRGAYITVPTGGVYAVDLVDTRNLPGVDAAGLLCVPQRIAATGVAFYGGASVVSVKVIAPGTAGSLSIYDHVTAADPLRLRYPVTAFGSLAADQIIRLGSRGCAASFGAMHVTVPTGGVVLINSLPR